MNLPSILFFLLTFAGPFAFGADRTAFARIIISSSESGSRNFCDGIVVGRRHVLTSATCFENADTKKDLVEVIADYKGSNQVNPKRYVVSKAWIPKDYRTSQTRQDIRSLMRSNIALLEAHSPQTRKWIGEEIEPWGVMDRYDNSELREKTVGPVQLISYQNDSNDNQVEVQSCNVDMTDNKSDSLQPTSCNDWDFALGSALFERVQNGNFLLTGLMTGINTANNTALVTYFGRFIGSMRDIIDGRNQNDFESVDVHWSSTSSLVFKNECSEARDLTLTVVYEDFFSGNQFMTIFHDVQPGDVLNTGIRTRSRNLFYRAVSDGGTWAKGDAHFLVHGISRSFTETFMNTDSNGDQLYNDKKLTVICSD